MNRKKRAKKGIKSLEKQIEIHEKKLEKAEKEGNYELSSYYKKEIKGLKKIKINKKEILEK